MFNNSQNNKEAVNVNTRGPQFMNKDGFDPSTMLVGYWNDLISIKMHPALEKSKQTDGRVFDYEKVVSTAITLEKATLLLDRIEKSILPAIEKGENKSVGVSIGSDSLIVVGTGVKVTGEVRPFFAIHKALHEKTKKPETSIAYEFSRSYSVDDYDPETGEFEITKDIHAEFLLFIEILKAARTAITQATAHSIRHVDKFYRDKMLATMNDIAEKLGVTTSGSSRGNYSKKTNVFNGGTNSTAVPEATTPTSIENLSNISDIDNYLN